MNGVAGGRQRGQNPMLYTNFAPTSVLSISMISLRLFLLNTTSVKDCLFLLLLWNSINGMMNGPFLAVSCFSLHSWTRPQRHQVGRIGRISYGCLKRCQSTTNTAEGMNQQQQQQQYAHPQHTTDYTIQNAPTHPTVLRTAVEKACASLDVYLSKKPIAAHTRHVFDDLVVPLVEASGKHHSIILDSGCGTGRSTLRLANEFPQSFVIGVDRSFVRLVQNVPSRQRSIIRLGGEDIPTIYHHDTNESSSSLRPFLEQITDNGILVRAELVEFWRCLVEKQQQQQQQQRLLRLQPQSSSSSWTIDKHYMFYPNPYPSKKRLNLRWYGHSSFPLLLQLAGHEMILRSNWKTYLQEFALSVEYAHEYYSSLESTLDDSSLSSSSSASASSVSSASTNWAKDYVESAKQGPNERINKTIAWTNFEQKYDHVGEPTYELILTKSRK